MATTPDVHIEQLLDIGVEEEFVLADRRDRASTPRADQVVTDATAHLGDRVQREFFASQVELNSRPCLSAEALRADLVQSRQEAAAAARRAGCLLVATGTSVLASEPPTVTENPRFAAMVDKFTFVGELPSESNACHIHLGKLGRDELYELSNRMRGWLPVIQALSANSPFVAGRDSGYASTRHFLQAHWPTVGPPPEFTVDQTYERTADQLVSSGTILDRQMIYWYARPSEHLPTLEIRVADVNADVDITLLAAVLARALATTLLAEAREGRPHHPVHDDWLVEAHRQAAVHGLSGRWSDPAAAPSPHSGTLMDALDALVARARPGLEAAGDTELAEMLLIRLREQGTGAERQRAEYALHHSLTDVVDRAAAVTVAG